MSPFVNTYDLVVTPGNRYFDHDRVVADARKGVVDTSRIQALQERVHGMRLITQDRPPDGLSLPRSRTPSRRYPHRRRRPAQCSR
jgi:hypothetical protein